MRRLIFPSVDSFVFRSCFSEKHWIVFQSVSACAYKNGTEQKMFYWASLLCPVMRVKDFWRKKRRQIISYEGDVGEGSQDTSKKKNIITTDRTGFWHYLDFCVTKLAPLCWNSQQELLTGYLQCWFLGCLYVSMTRCFEMKRSFHARQPQCKGVYQEDNVWSFHLIGASCNKCNK